MSRLTAALTATLRPAALPAALRPATLAAAFLPAALGAQSADPDWAAALDDLPPGFHTIEVDSVYHISAATREDALREMERKGPASDGQGPRLGIHLAQWRYAYRYEQRGGEARCRLADPQVLLRSVIVMPEWTNVGAAPREASEGWRAFLTALRTHEEGHRNRAKTQGVFLWQALLGLQARDCEDLERVVRETAERVLAEGRASQEAYDRQTGHGASQGAVWP